MGHTTTADLTLGTVVLDSYANPAVIVQVEMAGTRFVRYSIMQTCGSDRGRVGGLSGNPVLVEDAAQVKSAREIVRTEARSRGWKWNRDGIVR